MTRLRIGAHNTLVSKVCLYSIHYNRRGIFLGARTRSGMVPPTNDEILAYLGIKYFEVVTDRYLTLP